MRRIAVISFLLISTNAYAADEVLFNGEDLTGWTGTVGFPGAANPRKLENTWSVKDGAILCAGGRGNGGHLHTLKNYTNFVLSLEFRWGEIAPEVLKAGGNIYNAGIFFRSNPRTDPAMIVPFYYQAQIIHTPARASGEDGGGTGDMWIVSYDHPTFKGARASPPPAPRPPSTTQAAPTAQAGSASQGARSFRNRPLPHGVVPARNFPRLKFAEKPIGEWNTYEITANGDKVTYKLNGEVVNTGTGAVAIPGKIGLECENTPIAFRNIKIAPL